MSLKNCQLTKFMKKLHLWVVNVARRCINNITLFHTLYYFQVTETPTIQLNHKSSLTFDKS